MSATSDVDGRVRVREQNRPVAPDRFEAVDRTTHPEQGRVPVGDWRARGLASGPAIAAGSGNRASTSRTRAARRRPMLVSPRRT